MNPVILEGASCVGDAKGRVHHVKSPNRQNMLIVYSQPVDSLQFATLGLESRSELELVIQRVGGLDYTQV